MLFTISGPLTPVTSLLSQVNIVMKSSRAMKKMQLHYSTGGPIVDSKQQ